MYFEFNSVGLFTTFTGLLELGIILLGLYYVFNYKKEADKVISKKRSIRIIGKEIRFRQSKIFEFMYPYTMLAGGILLILIGVLAFFHVIRIG